MKIRWHLLGQNLLSRFTRFGLGEEEQPASDKRALAWRHSLNETVVCRLGRKTVPAELVDISESGMRLRLAERLERDDTVFVTSQEADGVLQQVNCRVAWCRGNPPEVEVGLEFNSSDENCYQVWLQRARPDSPSEAV
jgi:hypothetical protein